VHILIDFLAVVTFQSSVSYTGKVLLLGRTIAHPPS